MARWQLVTAHYLNTVDETEWEYQETDPVTQRARRKRYVVPLYIEAGSFVFQGKGQAGDTEFIGDPTPDMTPLDDEAKAESQKHMHKWRVSDYGVGSDALMDNLGKELAKAMATGQPVGNVGGVSAEAFASLQEQVKALMEQNTMLLGKLLEGDSKPRRI